MGIQVGSSMDEEILTTEDAATESGVSEDTLMLWEEYGIIILERRMQTPGKPGAWHKVYTKRTIDSFRLRWRDTL
jgi:DNA-binding transcriptional MerR regulator